MTENDYRLISLRYSCPLLKQEDILMGKVPTAPTIASIIGGMQVQEALKLLHDLPTAEGAALVFNGAANNFYQTKYSRREDCLSHETYESITSLTLGSNNTVRQLFNVLADTVNESIDSMRLLLDRDFLLRLVCRSCEIEKEIDQPLCEVGSRDGICLQCKQPLSTETTCEIAARSPLAERSLSSLGVPDYDIVKVATETETRFILLANDEGNFKEKALESE